MTIIPEKPAAFITLIAHEPGHDINAQLTDYFGNFIVLTQSQRETAKALRDSQYQLFILDLKLIDLADIRLIKNGPRWHDAPMLALTGEITITRRKELISQGFDDCLAKPLTVGKVDEAINLWLNQSGQDSSLTSAHNLLSRCRYNCKLAAALYTKIFEQFPQRLEDLDLALTSGRYQTAYDITHALDSEARICFLNDISAAAKTLGNALKHEEHESVQGDYAILNQKIMDFIARREMLLAVFKGTSVP